MEFHILELKLHPDTLKHTHTHTGILGRNETYNVVKFCNVENQGGTSVAEKVLLLISLQINDMEYI